MPSTNCSLPFNLPLPSLFSDGAKMEEQFLWTLFETAAKSANCEQLVRPFPSSYFDSTGQKDFTALISDVEQRSNKLYDWLREMLPGLQNCLRNPFIKRYFSTRKELRPDMILSVECNEPKENRFYQLFGDGAPSTVYGFHGSKPENFFSILQHGLVNNLNKRDVFGVGTYLSTEVSVALQFATSQRVNLEVGYFEISFRPQFILINIKFFI